MSTWEERMSLRAQEGIRIENERIRAENEAKWAAEDALEQARHAEAMREALEAGPPDGCGICYVWGRDFSGFGPPYTWWHVQDAPVPGPPPADWFWSSNPVHWCYHTCHGNEPVFCGPIAIAAS
jgi:hypothetical protein